MAAPLDGYESAISRVTELEVDLANAVTGLKRSQADNETLIRNQADLVNAHKWLQEQHERCRIQLCKEQEERQLLMEEEQQHVALWRSQLQDKARELEELQRQRPSPVQLEAAKLQQIEELEQSKQQQVQDFEGRLAIQAQRAAQAQKQMEQLRAELEQRLLEAQDQLAEQSRQHELRVQSLQRQSSAVEVELQAQKDLGATAWQSKAEVQELEARSANLQKAWEEQERRAEAERKASAEELLARTQELSVARRRAHELQVSLDSSERLSEQAASEAFGLRQERSRLLVQLAEAKAQLTQLTTPADSAQDPLQLQQELEQLRRSSLVERQQLQQRAQSVEEQLLSAQMGLRRAEAHARELEEEQAEQESQLQREREEAEQTCAESLSNLRADVERANKAAETQHMAWRGREAQMVRQVEEEKSRADALSDELVETKFADQEMDQRLREIRHKYHQREGANVAEFQKKGALAQIELKTIQERTDRLERERNEHTGAVEALRSSLKSEEERNDALQADLIATRQRLEAEQARCALEADEALVAATRSQEERRQAAINELTQSHKRQLAKLEAASKQALQKGARKRLELKQRCQELVKRLAQLQQERAMAVRVCDENRVVHETHLAQLGLASHLSPALAKHADGAATDAMPRSEFRGILGRLEESAERLKTSASGLVASGG